MNSLEVLIQNMVYNMRWFIIFFSTTIVFTCFSQRTAYGYQSRGQDKVEESTSMSIEIDGREIKFSLKGDLISYSMKFGDKIKKNYSGKIVSIGDLDIHYDYQGRIKNIGDKTVSYNYTGKISQIGNYIFKYDYQGNFEGTEEKSNPYRYWY